MPRERVPGYHGTVTHGSDNDDAPEAGQRRDFRGEFRQIIHADPLLARLAGRGYPHLPLRSTFAISVITSMLAVLTRNTVLAVVLGLLALAGNGAVVHLLARRDEQTSGVLLRLLRAGSLVVILLLVGTSLATPGPSSAAPRSRHHSGAPPLSTSSPSPSAVGLSGAHGARAIRGTP